MTYYLLSDYPNCARSPNGGLVAQEGGFVSQEKFFYSMKKVYLRFPAAMRSKPASDAMTATPGENGDLVVTGADVACVLVTSKRGALVSTAA